MTALYILAQEYSEAMSALADLDMDEQTVADTLEGLAGDLEVKAINVASFARNLEATAAQIKEAEAAMATRRQAIEKRAAGLRAYLMRTLQGVGITSVACPYFELSIRDNPPAVDIFDALQVPAEYMRTPEPPPAVPDKVSIKAALKTGADVAGCRLSQSKRLVIK